MVCFHNPDEENGYLSNWYLSDFVVEGQKFSSMEQYMMHKKALVFGDDATAAKVLETNDVGKIKALGRSVRNYNDIVWNGLRQIIIYQGLLQKFSQDQTLREQLLSTGDAILVECAVKDTVWAIGLSLRDERRFDMREWQGQNLLGFALMEVRRSLKGDD